ncbi:MAG TPA: methyltransferase [Croceibacterium sp.]
MHKSLGEMLDGPGDFPAWIQYITVAFTVIYTVDRLGLLADLDSRPRPIAEIAARSGCPVDDVARLLGFLAAEGVLAIDEHGNVTATARTEAMRATVQQQLGRMTLETGFAYPDAVGTGRTAYEARYGLPVFEHLRANPEIARMFGRVMSETTAMNEWQIFEQHAFRPFTLAVDVGGSQGSLLLRLLEMHPAARGVLFDLPDTVGLAERPVATAGYAGRVELVGGDFFAAVPSGGDLYLLKQILHDWSDAECRGILANIRAAMGEGTRLAVIERLLPEEYRPHNAYALDVIMLMWTTGRERRLSEYRAMLEACGFALDRVTENPDGMSVIEAVPV